MIGLPVKWEITPKWTEVWLPKRLHAQEKNYLWGRALFLGWQIWRAQLCLDWALGTGAELEAVLKTGSFGGKGAGG